MGWGTEIQTLDSIRHELGKFDLILEIESGRNPDGSFSYLVPDYSRTLPPTAVWFIDSHGNPTLHKRLAPAYDHVFFAVWNKRDLFADHRSAHWCPNATDLDHFYPDYNRPIEFDFGFFGSKGGLARANPLLEICEEQGWSYDIRQVGKVYRHRWPYTCEAMQACRNLFNHGQKHDGPNQRVIESMAVKRPLITDIDPNSGMCKLFDPGKHFIPYDTNYWDLESKLKWAMLYPDKAEEIADEAYKLVCEKHTITNRVDQMLEVINARSK